MIPEPQCSYCKQAAGSCIKPFDQLSQTFPWYEPAAVSALQPAKASFPALGALLTAS
jgi:hypothetical protein